MQQLATLHQRDHARQHHTVTAQDDGQLGRSEQQRRQV
jgi:hypothetical protein